MTPSLRSALERKRDEMAEKYTREYVNEWVDKQQFVFANHTTLQMSSNYSPGYKAGFDSLVPVVEKLVLALESGSLANRYTALADLKAWVGE